MAKKKIGLQFEGFEEYMTKLDKVANTRGLKRGVEAGLKSSKELVNPKILKRLSSGLPAGGRYSKGDTKKALNKDYKVSWDGSLAEIKVGFDMKKPGGVTSIFLIYGTPRMKPASGLKAAIYGKGTQREIAKVQEQEVGKVIKRIMEG